MEIVEKRVRTLIEEEYDIKINDKYYKYTDFVGEDGKMTSWSMVDDKNNNIIANEPDVITIVATIQNAVDRYNNKEPRHKETHNESTSSEDNEPSGDPGTAQAND